MPKAQLALKANNKLAIPNKTILKPGEVGATISWCVRKGIFDPNGEITEFQSAKRSESFVGNFMALLRGAMENTPAMVGLELTDTSNTLQLVHNNIYIFDVTSAINLDTKSIVVGTGNTAPTITDYALQTKIAHGAGAGQMSYSATTFAVPVSDGTTSQFTITRNFANGSGGSITVQEIGLISQVQDETQTNRYFLLIRDVIAGGIVVPNGQTLTVNYRPQAVV